MRVCMFSTCDRPHLAKGLCNAHYLQQRLGKPLRPLRRRHARPEVFIPDGFKYCPACEAVLPLSDFTPDSPRHRRYTCKPCRRPHRRDLRYNLPPGGYQTMYAAQGGVCAICKSPPPGVRDLCVDHDHACCPGADSCGRCIRGLLCNNCNAMLGMAKDNPDYLEAASQYLRKGALPNE